MSKVIKRRHFVGNTVAAATVALTKAGTLFATNEVSEYQIEITNFVYATEALSIKSGDKVTWVNMDIVPHTATAKDHTWDTGLINPGDSATIEVKAGMTESYFCEYHPIMTAEVNIEN